MYQVTIFDLIDEVDKVDNVDIVDEVNEIEIVDEVKEEKRLGVLKHKFLNFKTADDFYNILDEFNCKKICELEDRAKDFYLKLEEIVLEFEKNIGYTLNDIELSIEALLKTKDKQGIATKRLLKRFNVANIKKLKKENYTRFYNAIYKLYLEL